MFFLREGVFLQEAAHAGSPLPAVLQTQIPVAEMDLR